MNTLKTLSFVLLALIVLSGCQVDTGGSTGTGIDKESLPEDTWIWTSGSYLVNHQPVYGTMGLPERGNSPGSRFAAVLWRGKSGNLMLFGGYNSVSGIDSFFNDMWTFNGKTWVWVGGSDQANQSGVYGLKNVASPTNWPGSRFGSSFTVDRNGNLWLFGGSGYDGYGNWGYLGDLWKYDGSRWTWISGLDRAEKFGVYGTKGIADSGNFPGCRDNAILTEAAGGGFWLFGGSGYAGGIIGVLNDFWKFDGENWTWISGLDTAVNSSLVDSGVWGTKGSGDPANTPSARYSASGCSDRTGNLYLFGGYGKDINRNSGNLNDLWRFDGTQWTWLSGENIIAQPGSYGQKGVPADTNVPGGRQKFVLWIDTNGDLNLFGGNGHDSTGGGSYLNDLWRFDGTLWTWISGSDTGNQPGRYSIDLYPSDVPGGRSDFASWQDNDGTFWIFGGSGLDGTGNSGYLGDLWSYKPH